MYSAIWNIPAATQPNNVRSKILESFSDYNEAHDTSYTVAIPNSGVMPSSHTNGGKSNAHFITSATRDEVDLIFDESGLIGQCWGFQSFGNVIPATYDEQGVELTPAMPLVTEKVKQVIWNNQDDVLDEFGDPTGEKVGLHVYSGQAPWFME